MAHNAGATTFSKRHGGAGHALSVVGIPKTIDNDVAYVARTFGFQTAVEEASRVLAGAHAEAHSVENGISVVKLMGRDAGFIAAGATIANQDVNFTLVPEVPFKLDGESGFLAALKRRVVRRKHAVVVVAEGAGQDLLISGESRPRCLRKPEIQGYRLIPQTENRDPTSKPKVCQRLSAILIPAT